MGPISLFLFVCLLRSCFAAEEADASLIVVRASREVDLSSSVVKQSVTFSFENSGTNPVSSFLYVVDANVASNLAYISAEVSCLCGGKSMVCNFDMISKKKTLLFIFLLTKKMPF